MNLSKSLFNMSKKMMKSAVKDIKSSSTYKPKQTKIVKSEKSYNLDDLYDEFESKYYKTCEKMAHKVYSVNTDNIDPDKNVDGFKKMFELAHELEDFCVSHGQGGVAFFNENYSDIYQGIQGDLDSYMSDKYAEEKEAFEEYKARKKAIKSISDKIIKELRKSSGSALQTELKKMLTENELFYYNATINELIESGKIEKVKIGSRVSYKTK